MIYNKKKSSKNKIKKKVIIEKIDSKIVKKPTILNNEIDFYIPEKWNY